MKNELSKSTSVTGSFDEVLDSQKIFRTLLRSMSFPGRVFSMDEVATGFATKELQPCASIMQTLLDDRASFCVLPAESGLSGFIRAHTGANEVALEEADFVFVTDSQQPLDYKRLKTGSHVSPEKGATVVYQLAKISGSGGRQLKLSGPGIKDTILVEMVEMPSSLIDVLKVNQFPTGVDVILVDSGLRVMGIPRSTRVEVVI